MRRGRIGSATAALAVLLVACGNGSPSASSVGSSTAPTHQPSVEDFDPANFVGSSTVDNRWLPLVPGTQLVWEGHAMDGTDKIRRRVVFTVTDLTKEIDGVQALVGWDLDYNDGVLEEGELAFFAQDLDGNVWHLGEYPEEYEDGKVVKTPLWIPGVAGALPGIAMKAEPEPGFPSYAQGLGPQVGWHDRGQVYRVGERTCAATGCYEDVVVTKEFSRSEPGAYQLKYYAPGVGNVRVGWGGPNEDEHEVLVLTSLRHLDAEAMAEVRASVLAQEARAYRLSPDVYGTTAPAEPLSAG